MSVLIKPLVTEKVSAMNEEGKYGFVVSKDANKIQIKTAVEKAYGVTVESVNTMGIVHFQLQMMVSPSIFTKKG